MRLAFESGAHVRFSDGSGKDAAVAVRVERMRFRPMALFPIVYLTCFYKFSRRYIDSR